MQLHLDILPTAQRDLWQLFNQIPKQFILYGGTAIALQLGHRVSVDFDFFSTAPFLAGLGERQKRLLPVLIAEENGVQIASLHDLFATKLNTVQHRAQRKDYIDIDAVIRSGIKLEEGLACALAVYGPSFDPASSLRALCSYRDGDLPDLEPAIKSRLSELAAGVEEIPVLKSVLKNALHP